MLHLTKINLNLFKKSMPLELAKRTIAIHYEKNSPTSTSTSVTDAPEQKDEVGAKPSTKLPPRLPLVKNFFVGLVDKELLAFPEVISRENMKRLNNEILPLQNYFNEDFDYKSTSRTYTYPKDLAENLQNLGMYGLNVGEEFDGKGWGYSGSLMNSEPETKSTEVASSLVGHRAVVDTIQELGTDEQKHRFLPKLAKGTFVATAAISELDTSEYDLFNTKAVYESDSHTWVLNGTKAFVVSPPKTPEASNIYLVVAQTQQGTLQNLTGQTTTVFLVDSNAAGVKVGERHQTIGCRANAIHYLHLDNVRVADTSVLGHPDGGVYVVEAFLKAMRLRSALVGVGLAKNVVKAMTQEAIQKKICGVDLKDIETVQMSLAKSTMEIYAMESIIYLTAGLLDEFQSPDVVMETTISKYYTLRHLLNICVRSLDLIGSKSLLSGEDTEQYFRNMAHLYTESESIDNLSIFIALCGLQYAGNLTGDIIRKQRNPAFNPLHIFSKFMETSNIDNPKTNMNLQENLHPTLGPPSLALERSVARLQMCVNLVLTRYGSSVVEQHNEVRRIADMSSIIYASYASLSRASRSYCIGLPMADTELLTAASITIDGHDKVKVLTNEIFNGRFVNNDDNLQTLWGRIINSKGYFATHPLTYNF